MIDSIFSHYRIVEELGRGGMGVVYRAEDTRLGRIVALKFLAEHLVREQSARDRFMREARAAASLSHSNIATLYDVAEHDGKLFLAMEFVEGNDLAHVLRSSRLTAAQIVNYVSQVASGLGRAHESGIVHRDVKPGNVIITSRDEAKLLDFGIARFAGTSEITMPGSIVGTASYMSPEQLSGMDVDYRTDLWSLGVMLYEMLCRKRPFDGDYQQAIQYAVLNADPIPVSSVRPEYGTAFDTILTQLLAKDRDRRYASAADLLRDLSGVDVTNGDVNRVRETTTTTRTEVTPATRPLVRETTDERRQLTEVYFEISNYGDLSARMDPEDLVEFADHYRLIFEAQVERFGGLCGPRSGGVMHAWFGYPSATDNDPRRAIRCALALRAAVAQAPAASTPQRAEIRIGLHTGIAVISDVHGNFEVHGNIGNIAAHVAASGPAGSVTVSSHTKRLCAGYFDSATGEPVDVPGLSGTVETFQVVRESAARTRLDFVSESDLSPLVGRDAEMAILRRGWKQAKSGQGSTVFITAEAGLGKSRLVDSMLREANQDPASWSTNLYCSSFNSASALYPLVDYLNSNAFRAEGGSVPGDRFAELRSFLSDAGISNADDLFVVADLLGVELPDDFARPNLAAAEQQRRSMMTLLQLLTYRCGEQPGMIVVEDLHWADPSTLALVDLLISQAPAQRLLILCTSRPEFRASMAGKPRTAELTLDRLDPDDLATISQHRSRKRLPDEIVAHIASKTDGVPLFTEELTNMIVESGILKDCGDRYELAGPLPNFQIPSTLHGSLVARLDRLPSEKPIAQIGALLGREFTYDLLRDVSGHDDATLTAALDKLVASELIYQVGFVPDSSYIFKHALIQDVAYHTLLKAQRRKLHKRAAAALKERGVAPEAVARHFAEAGEVDQAIPLYQQAGLASMQRNANSEAVQHLSQARALVEKLPEGRERDQTELAILNLLGPATNMTRGHWDPEGERILSRATELCERIDALEPLAMALQGLISTYMIRGDYELAVRNARRIEEAADESGSAEFSVMAHTILSAATLFTGRLKETIVHSDEVKRSYDPKLHARLAYLGWGSLDVTSEIYRNLASHLLGHADASLGPAIEMFRKTQNAAYHFDYYMASLFLGMQRLARREYHEANAVLTEYLVAGQQYGDPFAIALTSIFQRLSKRGQEEEAEFRVGRMIMDQLTQAGFALGYSFMLGQYAEGLIHFDHVNEAITVLDEADAHLARTGPEFWSPEIKRLRAETLLRIGGSGETAGEFLEQSIEIAREQGNRMLELRSTSSLAKRLVDSGKSTEARERLACIYDTFTEGFETVDLIEANGILQSL
ncbi:MAG: protein kinase [Rhodothermales bacterium]